MTKQVINIGVTANDRSGDPIRTAFNKVNQNFTELYTLTGGTAADLQELVQDYAAPLFTHNYHTGITFTYDDINNRLVAVVSDNDSSYVTSTNLTTILDSYATESFVTTQGYITSNGLPSQTGNNGKYLSTDGNGTLTWKNVNSLNNGSYVLNIDSYGNVTLPGTTVFPGNNYGQFQTPPAQNTYVTEITPIVIFSGTNNLVETMKATIQVQADGVDVGNVFTYHSQICEILVVRKRIYDANIDSTSYAVEAMVYGVIHTSTNQLATFDAHWNPTTNKIEITMTRDPSYIGVNARVIAIESVNLAP